MQYWDATIYEFIRRPIRRDRGKILIRGPKTTIVRIEAKSAVCVQLSWTSDNGLRTRLLMTRPTPTHDRGTAVVTTATRPMEGN